MTSQEMLVLGLDVIILVLVNFLMLRRKEALYRSKNLWIYFMAVKATVVLPAVLTALQMYVFVFGYVAKIGNPMYYLVMYSYIGYLLLCGFILFMAENQVNLLRIMSVILMLYQFYMAYQMIYNRAVFDVLLDSAYNLFRYGDLVGYGLALCGSCLSLLGTATAWNYWRGNAKQDFTR